MDDMSREQEHAGQGDGDEPALRAVQTASGWAVVRRTVSKGS
jgi:hypothetical protein